MAVTNVFVGVDHLGYYTAGRDGYAGPAAGTSVSPIGPFTLTGGRYCVMVVGATFGTVTLQLLGPDGSTQLTMGSAFAANGVQILDLPPGKYQFALA